MTYAWHWPIGPCAASGQYSAVRPSTRVRIRRWTRVCSRSIAYGRTRELGLKGRKTGGRGTNLEPPAVPAPKGRLSLQKPSLQHEGRSHATRTATVLAAGTLLLLRTGTARAAPTPPKPPTHKQAVHVPSKKIRPDTAHQTKTRPPEEKHPRPHTHSHSLTHSHTRGPAHW